MQVCFGSQSYCDMAVWRRLTKQVRWGSDDMERLEDRFESDMREGQG